MVASGSARILPAVGSRWLLVAENFQGSRAGPMAAIRDTTSAVSHFLHRHLLKLIILGYVLAAALPGPGLWIQAADPLSLVGFRGVAAVTVPMLLLWLLLFNAGLRVRAGRIGRIARRPGMV